MRNKYATKRQFSQPKTGRIFPQKRIPKIVSNAWRCTTFVFNYLYDLIEFFKTILIFKKFPNDTHNPSNLKVPFLLLFLPLFFPLFYPLFFPLFYPLFFPLFLFYPLFPSSYLNQIKSTTNFPYYLPLPYITFNIIILSLFNFFLLLNNSSVHFFFLTNAYL